MKFAPSLAALVLGVASPAFAQATVMPDGQWRAALGLGASASSGNAKTTIVSFTEDAVRARMENKAPIYGNAQSARTGDQTAAE